MPLPPEATIGTKSSSDTLMRMIHGIARGTMRLWKESALATFISKLDLTWKRTKETLLLSTQQAEAVLVVACWRRPDEYDSRMKYYLLSQLSLE